VKTYLFAAWMLVVAAACDPAPWTSPDRQVAVARCGEAMALRPTVADVVVSDLPTLKDVDHARRQIRQAYQGIEADPDLLPPRLFLLIDAEGEVVDRRIIRSSGNIAADSAAVRASYGYEFRPAHYRNTPVCYWIALPFPPPGGV